MFSTKVDVIASLPHYRRHIMPIYDALPDELKGDVHPIRPAVRGNRNHVALVAGWQDVAPLRGLQKMIYVEHGAGQSYAGDERSVRWPAYAASGGIRHTGVLGFIAPNQRVADQWKTAPAVAVGCPKLDRWRDMRPRGRAVCFAWHWPCAISPEAGTAYHHYEAALPEVVERFSRQGFMVYGHAHPRWEGRLDDRLEAAGFAVLPSEEEVFSCASYLFVDNSSLGIEFMSLGRPVAWLNSPFYRRDVNHGGRFWDWTEGMAVIDEPDELLTFNVWDFTLWSVTGGRAERAAEIAGEVYAYQDDQCGQRAADFVVKLLHDNGLV